MKNVIFFLLCLISSATMAQTWPGQQITIVNSLPVGTTPDVIGRRVADELAKKLNVTVVTENRPGAGGLVALQHFVGLGNKDGNVLYIGDSSNFIHAPLLYRQEALLSKVQPVSALYTASPVIVTSATIGNKLGKEHIVQHPFYGSWGTGSWGHICGLEFAENLGTTAQHVPYTAVGMWFADLSNNIMSFSCTSIGTSTPSVRSGKLHHVAVTTKKRDPLLPNVPTMKEAFGKEITTNEQWVAVYAGRSVPEETVELISSVIQDILKTNTMSKAIQDIYGHPFVGSRSSFAKLYQDDYSKIKTLLERHKISID